MPQHIDIVLGGRTFAVQQLTIRADAAWRKKVKEIVEPISELATGRCGGRADAGRPAQVVGQVPALIVDPGAVIDAVLDYSPTLANEREWIETNAYSDEALQALLALFFGMTAAANGSTPKLPVTT
ncbi:MAG: hypothetical protein IPM06_19810 [Rhizobiales bacterium]|nr:hypothetical protein [Hyphomicrobiales bacterium]